jgi:hypothetical protein
MALAFDIGRATVAGVEAREAKGKLRFDGKGLQIDQLAVADLGGAAFTASGMLDTSVTNPRGNVSVDLDARDLSGVIALLARVAPALAEPLRRAAPSPTAAKLKATLDVAAAPGGSAAATLARLGIDGRRRRRAPRSTSPARSTPTTAASSSRCSGSTAPSPWTSGRAPCRSAPAAAAIATCASRRGCSAAGSTPAPPAPCASALPGRGSTAR